MGDAVADLLFGDDNDAQNACIRVLHARINETKLVALETPVEASGSGIYLLYYTGSRRGLYGGMTQDCPLYVGKALAKVGNMSHLETRLSQHRKSVRDAEDLQLDEFGVKVVPVNEDWVAGCETVLIKYWEPLWNTVLTGFGNHAPGRGRKNQRRSLWDTLHVGRRWAAQLEPEVPTAYVRDKVLEWCERRGYPPFHNLCCEEIVNTFSV